MIKAVNHHKGFTTLTNILTNEDIENFNRYFKKLSYFSNVVFSESDGYFVLNAKGQYCDIVGESLLLHIQPYIEKVVQKKLLPTYSFQRTYHKGGELKKHVDRPSCEISCTLTVDFDDQAPNWPIFIELNEKDVAVPLDKGEALVYYGCDTKHWRNHFEGEYSYHYFLHFVDANGSNTAYKFDKRHQINGNPDFRKVLQSRIKTLENLEQLDLKTQIRPIHNDIYFEILNKEDLWYIKLNKSKKLGILFFMKPFVESLFEQKDIFSLDQFSNRVFDKTAIDLLKKLILLGYFEIVFDQIITTTKN